MCNWVLYLQMKIPEETQDVAVLWCITSFVFDSSAKVGEQTTELFCCVLKGPFDNSPAFTLSV